MISNSDNNHYIRRFLSRGCFYCETEGCSRLKGNDEFCCWELIGCELFPLCYETCLKCWNSYGLRLAISKNYIWLPFVTIGKMLRQELCTHEACLCCEIGIAKNKCFLWQFGKMWPASWHSRAITKIFATLNFVTLSVPTNISLVFLKATFLLYKCFCCFVLCIFWLLKLKAELGQTIYRNLSAKLQNSN